MAILENEKNQFLEPENSNILTVDPEDLMRDNPAALIVNQDTYNRMSAYFNPDQFDLPQVVKVRTYSSQHGAVIKLFVVDGLTRTKYVRDHKKDIASQHPDFRFEVRDVTNSNLHNTEIVHVDEREEGQQALTMIQYLRAVVPPTIKHSEIAPDRIAAHLINGWDNMVGEQLAKKFSALAALSFLANPNVPTATPVMLRTFISGQRRIIAGETKETINERVTLQDKLLEMADILRESKLLLEKKKVARAAFELVAKRSPIIGGEEKSIKQIYGLLYSDEIEDKLEDAFPEVGNREEMRQQLGDFIMSSLSKFIDRPNREQAIDIFDEVLKDRAMNFNHAVDILTSPSPAERYNQIRQELNRVKLVKAYSESHKKAKLTDNEAILIGRLGTITTLSGRDIPAYIRSIKEADTTLAQAFQFLTQLQEQHSRLIQNGVPEAEVAAAIEHISTLHESLLSSNTISNLSIGKDRLRSATNEAERRISRRIKSHQVAVLVDDMYGERMQTGFGPQIKPRLIEYIMRECDINSDPNAALNERQIRNTLGQLRKLEDGLQSRVIQGEIRLSRAEQMQRESRFNPQPGKKPEIEKTPPVSNPAVTRREESSLLVHPPKYQPKSEEQIILDKKAVEVRRIGINLDRYSRVTKSYMGELLDIGLDPADLTEEVKRDIDLMLRFVGKLRFAHPDISRLITDTLEQQKRTVKIREAQVYQEQEDAEKDNRTKR